MFWLQMGLEIREERGSGRQGLWGAGLGTTPDSTAVLEDAVMDMMPDETTDMFSKRRVMHWDRRKKKFVQVCVCASVRGIVVLMFLVVLNSM